MINIVLEKNKNFKFSGRIIVSKNESDAHWQQNDYKGFAPNVDWDTVDFKKSPAIQELPVISAICEPLEGQAVKVKNGKIKVKGELRIISGFILFFNALCLYI